MKKWFSANKIQIIGALLGAVAGFLYWKFVGCSSGKCWIKSNPYYMTTYGAVFGILLANLIKK